MKSIKVLFLVLVLFIFISPALAQGDAQKPKAPAPQNISMEDRVRFVVPFARGGWICKQGDFLYFYDRTLDATKLYRMKKDTKTREVLENANGNGEIFKLKAHNGKLFYIRTATKSDFPTKSALYSYDIAHDKEVKLTDKNVYSYAIKGDMIYFTIFSPDSKQGTPYGLYKIKTDGTGRSLITRLKSQMAVQIEGDKIYLGYGKILLTMNLDGSGRKEIPLNHFYFLVHKGSVYYIDASKGIDVSATENSHLYRHDLAEPKTKDVLVSKQEVRHFIINEDKIYLYDSRDRIWSADIDGKNERQHGFGCDLVAIGNDIYFIAMGGRIGLLGEKKTEEPAPQEAHSKRQEPTKFQEFKGILFAFWRTVCDAFYTITQAFMGQSVFEEDSPSLALPIVVEGKDTPENIARQNTVGNRFAGGYIAEKDGFLYFANPEDGNKLYRMDKNGENKVKLKDRVNLHNLQFYGNKLFYLESKHQDTSVMNTLYSFDLKTKREKALTNYQILEIEDYVFAGDWIYFIARNNLSELKSCVLYKIKPDGRGKKLIDRFWDSAGSIQIFGDKIFLFFGDKYMITMNLDGSDKRKREREKEKIYVNGETTLVYGGNIYYQKTSYGSLYVGDLNDPFKKSKSLMQKRDIPVYNIVDNTLYYSDVNGSNGKYKCETYKADLDGKNEKFVVNGCKPIILNGVIYYYDNYVDNERKLLFKRL